MGSELFLAILNSLWSDFFKEGPLYKQIERIISNDSLLSNVNKFQGHFQNNNYNWYFFHQIIDNIYYIYKFLIISDGCIIEITGVIISWSDKD